MMIRSELKLNLMLLGFALKWVSPQEYPDYYVHDKVLVTVFPSETDEVRASIECKNILGKVVTTYFDDLSDLLAHLGDIPDA
jgi:hypothetical protein